MTLGLMWAQTRVGVIGHHGRLPWHLPEDLAHFREVTSGHPVIMGRATWQSLPERFRPLPRRVNVVLSRDPGFVAPGARVAASLAAALAFAHDEAGVLVPSSDEAGAPAPSVEAWVIGGAAVFAEALPLADRLEVTEVALDVVGDTFAPRIDPAEWTATLVGSWQESRTGLRYRFLGYERVR